jgi:hypothetical protein
MSRDLVWKWDDEFESNVSSFIHQQFVLKLLFAKGFWVRGHALNRDAIFKKVCADPNAPYTEAGLMAIVHQTFGLHERDFCPVFSTYLPSSDANFQFVLIHDMEISPNSIKLMTEESRELMRLPYNIDQIINSGLIEKDLNCWRSVY